MLVYIAGLKTKYLVTILRLDQQNNKPEMTGSLANDKAENQVTVGGNYMYLPA